MREKEQDINQPDIQTIQPGSEPAQIAVMGNALHDNVTSSSTCQQLDQLDARVIDIGTNTSDIEVRSQKDVARIVDLDNDNVQVSCPHVQVIPMTGTDEQVHVSHSNLSTSRYDPKLTTIPQLDGLVSVQTTSRGRRLSECARIEQDSVQRITPSHRREYPDEGSNDSYNDRRSYWDHRPPERGRHQGHNGRPPDRKHYYNRGYPGRDYTGQNGRPHDNGRPPNDGGPPDGGGPLDDGGPPSDGGPPNNGRPLGDG